MRMIFMACRTRRLRGAVLAAASLIIQSSFLAAAASAPEPDPACDGGRSRAHGCEYRLTLAPEGYLTAFGTRENGGVDYRLKTLESFAAAHPDIRIDILLVEADITALDPEIQRRLLGSAGAPSGQKTKDR